MTQYTPVWEATEEQLRATPWLPESFIEGELERRRKLAERSEVAERVSFVDWRTPQEKVRDENLDLVMRAIAAGNTTLSEIMTATGLARHTVIKYRRIVRGE